MMKAIMFLASAMLCGVSAPAAAQDANAPGLGEITVTSNRQAARSRGICPAISYRKKIKDKPTFFPMALYRGRARIEQTMGKLKRFKRATLRCEKIDQNCASFVALALSFILIESVHTT